jgi:LysM repeat protein
VVKSGELLSSIAAKHQVSVADIKRWNNLKSNSVYKGQKLVIRNSEAGNEQSNPNNNNVAQTDVKSNTDSNSGTTAQKTSTTST